MEQNYQKSINEISILQGKVEHYNKLLIISGLINTPIDLSFLDKLAILLSYIKDTVYDSNGVFVLQWFNPFKWLGYYKILRTILSMIWDIIIAIKGGGVNPIPISK